MSGYVHYAGKITEVKVNPSQTLEETAKSILDEKGYYVPDYYDSNLEYLTDELHEYIVIFEKLYFIEKEDVMFEPSLKSETNKDGSINFDVKFHNGGYGIEEAIEEAIKKNK